MCSDLKDTDSTLDQEEDEDVVSVVDDLEYQLTAIDMVIDSHTGGGH